MIIKFTQIYNAIIKRFFEHWFAKLIRNIVGAPAIGGVIEEGAE